MSKTLVMKLTSKRSAVKVLAPFDWLAWMEANHVELVPEFSSVPPFPKRAVPVLWRAGVCERCSRGWTTVRFSASGDTALAALKRLRAKITRRARDAKRVKIKS